MWLNKLLLATQAMIAGRRLFVVSRSSLTCSKDRLLRRQVPLLEAVSQPAIAMSSDQKPKITVDREDLKKKLTPEQYHVTQEQGTEAPWTGEYLTLKENGMYGCVVCGADLFSSDTKYESGCGWPAFYDVDPTRLMFKEDLRHGRKRTEVTCSNCDAHLGHVFDDGPADKTGKRYCINSVSLSFKKKSTDGNSQ